MTWEDINQNLAKRKKDTMASNFHASSQPNLLVLTSSHDLGVIRNGGRNGSLWGPRAILSTLKKMANTNFKNPLHHIELCQMSDMKLDFDQFQKDQTTKIKDLLGPIVKKTEKESTIIHLGSGHDHIYELTCALLENCLDKRFTIINLDAHLDTRVDDIHHSGTPFRQIKKQFAERVDLIQVGIHDFANAESNFSEIDMNIYSMNDIDKETNHQNNNEKFLNELFSKIPERNYVILSLDLDALDQSQFKAVSAPNHHGLSFKFLREIIYKYKTEITKRNQHLKVFGAYEYNPLFDDHACSNARALNEIIYQLIK